MADDKANNDTSDTRYKTEDVTDTKGREFTEFEDSFLKRELLSISKSAISFNTLTDDKVNNANSVSDSDGDGDGDIDIYIDSDSYIYIDSDSYSYSYSEGEDEDEDEGEKNAADGEGNNNQPTPESKPTQTFTGVTAEMNGMTITANPPQGSTCETQYRELIQQLKIYASSKYYGSQVIDSIDNLKMLSPSDFLPDAVEKEDYTIILRDEEGLPTLILTKEDTQLKEALTTVYNEGVDTADERFNAYRQGLCDLFEIVMGQLDPPTTCKVKSLQQWASIKEKRSTISLLNILQEICFRESHTKVDAISQNIRAKLELLCYEQRKTLNQRKTAKDIYEVLKSMKGSIVDTQVLVESLKFHYLTLAEYEALGEAEKQIQMNRAEQLYLHRLIFDASRCNFDCPLRRRKSADEKRKEKRDREIARGIDWRYASDSQVQLYGKYFLDVDPIVQNILAKRKLLCSRQHNKSHNDFVKKVTKRYEALKSMKGSLVDTQVLVESLKKDNMTLAEYEALGEAEKQIQMNRAEQRCLVWLILEGSNETINDVASHPSRTSQERNHRAFASRSPRNGQERIRRAPSRSSRTGQERNHRAFASRSPRTGQERMNSSGRRVMKP